MWAVKNGGLRDLNGAQQDSDRGLNKKFRALESWRESETI